jgi:hypothetical protein
MDLPKQGEAVTPAPASPASDAPAKPQDTPTTESPAFAKFRSCRWHQPKENGNAEFCTHREVKPYAGTSGFDADAWCPECQYYKLRRSPKKKQGGDDFSY